jgi:hypothetical protein
MPLVFFRSRAAAEVIMIAEHAQRLLDVIGRDLGSDPARARGVIRGKDLDDAITQLSRAVEADRAGPRDPFADEGVPAALRHVSLAQRAFPLLEMLRAAQRRGVDVTWGI